MSGFQKGKRKRLSMEETRQAVIDAGRRLLQERGLDAGLGLVPLNDAILESGVPRASAYRVYQSDEIDPQDGFRSELITSYVGEVATKARTTAVGEIAADVLTTVDTSDPASLSTGLREIIRLGSAANLEALMQDKDWRVLGPSLAVTSLAPTAPSALADAHQALLQESRRFYRTIFEPLASVFGLRLRDGLTWDDLGLLAEFGAIIASFYRPHHPELAAIPRQTGPDGQMQDWTHGAILFEGFLLASMESDPAADVSADLTLWLG